MKKEKRTPWRVRAVAFGRSLDTYAKKFEDTLNTYARDGYSIQVNGVLNKGVIIVGQDMGISAAEETEPPPRPGPGLQFSTMQIVGPLLRVIDTADDAALDNIASLIVARWPAEGIQEALMDCERFAATHEMDPEHTCDGPRDLRRVLVTLRKKLTATLS